MKQQGYYDGEVDGLLSPTARRSLRAFVGNENFEERVDLEAATMDEPVFDFLVTKFPH